MFVFVAQHICISNCGSALVFAWAHSSSSRTFHDVICFLVTTQIIQHKGNRVHLAGIMRREIVSLRYPSLDNALGDASPGLLAGGLRCFPTLQNLQGVLKRQFIRHQRGPMVLRHTRRRPGPDIQSVHPGYRYLQFSACCVPIIIISNGFNQMDAGAEVQRCCVECVLNGVTSSALIVTLNLIVVNLQLHVRYSRGGEPAVSIACAHDNVGNAGH